MDLFNSLPVSSLPGTPLAERLRPEQLAAFVGQDKVLRQIQKYISAQFLPSMIFWGPPGTGKTSLARALANQFSFYFESVNAVESGAKQLKEIGEAATQRRREMQKQTMLFVDEIHRFNKAQQDVLLPFIERGEITLIGATTENPSYELNRALLSRCRLVVFEKLDLKSLRALLVNAISKEGLKDIETYFSPEALNWFLTWVDGDGRRLLTSLEEILADYSLNAKAHFPLSLSSLQQILGSSVLGYDKSSDQHYDVISAFIKSIRGSDVDAALYYLARMIKGGEDPVFIARRLVILASEDIGNADPRALSIAVSGLQAVELVGMPECAIGLSQVVCYLASAPKSNRSYMALKKAQDCVERTGTLPIPLHLRSSKSAPMQELGYGQGYLYPHDYPRGWVPQEYLPESILKESFYQPSDVGFEKQIKEFQKWLKGQ